MLFRKLFAWIAAGCVLILLVGLARNAHAETYTRMHPRISGYQAFHVFYVVKKQSPDLANLKIIVCYSNRLDKPDFELCTAPTSIARGRLPFSCLPSGPAVFPPVLRCRMNAVSTDQRD